MPVQDHGEIATVVIVDRRRNPADIPAGVKRLFKSANIALLCRPIYGFVADSRNMYLPSTGPRFTLSGFFNPAVIETNASAALGHERELRKEMWTLLVLELWMQQMGSARLAGYQLVGSPV